MVSVGYGGRPPCALTGRGATSSTSAAAGSTIRSQIESISNRQSFESKIKSDQKRIIHSFQINGFHLSFIPFKPAGDVLPGCCYCSLCCPPPPPS